MILNFHIWLEISMALIFWAKVYITFQKKRLDDRERRVDLIIDSIFAILFTFASMDLITTLPEIMDLIIKIKSLTG